MPPFQPHDTLRVESPHGSLLFANIVGCSAMCTHPSPPPILCSSPRKPGQQRGPISLFRDRLGTGAEPLDKPRPGPWPTLSTLNLGSLLVAKVHTPSRCTVPGTQSRTWDTREACVDALNVTNGGGWSTLLIPPDSVSSSMQWGQPAHLTGWVCDQIGSHLSSTVSGA